MRLESKSVVVTGASSGMGKAIVELFVREGAKVVAVARRKERLEELAASLADAPGEVIVYQGDVTKEEVNEAMIDCAVEKFGKLDVLTALVKSGLCASKSEASIFKSTSWC